MNRIEIDRMMIAITVTQMNIVRIEQAIFDNRRVTVYYISVEMYIIVGSVKTVIHEHPQFLCMNARLVP